LPQPLVPLAPARAGERWFAAFVPVMLDAPAAAPSSAMAIVLADGRSLRFDASIDAAACAAS